MDEGTWVDGFLDFWTMAAKGLIDWIGGSMMVNGIAFEVAVSNE
jgi:hypothetical protein